MWKSVIMDCFNFLRRSKCVAENRLLNEIITQPLLLMVSYNLYRWKYFLVLAFYFATNYLDLFKSKIKHLFIFSFIKITLKIHSISIFFYLGLQYRVRLNIFTQSFERKNYFFFYGRKTSEIRKNLKIFYNQQFFHYSFLTY